MDTTSFVSEAIRYQKEASDQVFQLISLYQSNTEELMQKTLDQCAWLPENSKEHYLSWNSSCQETTKYLQEIFDKGFEQVEQVFVSPASSEGTDKEAKPKKQAAAPTPVSAERKKTSATPKRKVKTAAPKVTKKAATSKTEPIKSASSKTKSSEQKSQTSAAVRTKKTPVASDSVGAQNVSDEAASSKAKPVTKQVQRNDVVAVSETPTTSTS